MRIYYANKEYKHIVIVPREFRPVNDEALEIVSSEIEVTVREAGVFVGSLVLHTPFKDGLGCFITAQTRKEGLLDARCRFSAGPAHHDRTSGEYSRQEAVCQGYRRHCRLKPQMDH